MENLLLKKLQIKAGFTTKVVDMPKNHASIFGDLPENTTLVFSDTASFDALILFSTSKAQLKVQIQNQLKNIGSKTIFWIFMPKKTADIPSDLELMKDWQILNGFGLNPCSSVSVNSTWTALRVKFADEIKASGLRNEHIKLNNYSDYIDVDNKLIKKLPEDFDVRLHANTKALAHFNSLSYSNKKEYILWIVSAKQDKTRETRTEKALEMLTLGKKNPAEK